MLKRFSAIVALLLLLQAVCPQSVRAASTWNPTLLVNTESFHVIDEADAASDVEVRFGQTTNEKLFYDRMNNRFQFSRSLKVAGQLTTTGAAIVNVGSTSATPDAGIALEVVGTASGRIVHAQDALTSSGSLRINGVMTGATAIHGAGLADCDDGANSKLLWDSATGRFSCGSDQNSGGSGIGQTNADARYVNTSSDTMTGTLTFRPALGPNTVALNVAGTMSGRALQVTGTGARPLIYTDVATGRVGIGTGSNLQFLLDVSGSGRLFVFDKGGQVYNVKAFGATGNGTTDDYAAIAAAISAASAAGGGRVYFPIGKYITSTEIQVPERVYLTGAAAAWETSGTVTKGSTIYLKDSAGLTSSQGVVKFVYNGSDTARRCMSGARDITIHGNRGSNTDNVGILIEGCRFVHLDRVHVIRAGSDGVKSISHAGSSTSTNDLEFNKIFAGWNGGDGFDISGGDNIITHSIAGTNDLAGFGISAGTSTFQGNHSWNNGRDGFTEEGSSPGNHYIGNQAYDNDRAGFWFASGTSHVQIAGNVANDNGRDSVTYPTATHRSGFVFATGGTFANVNSDGNTGGNRNSTAQEYGYAILSTTATLNITGFKANSNNTADTSIAAGALVYSVFHNARVGIGTTTSTPKDNLVVSDGDSGVVPNGTSVLSVEDNANAAISVLTPNTAVGFLMFGDVQDAYTGGIEYSHSTNAMTFQVNDVDVALITSSGNVGIGEGNASPGSPLSVSGSTIINPNGTLGSTAAETALEVVGTVSGSALTFMGGTSYIMGGLGVGTRTPGVKLEINGGVAFATGALVNITADGQTVTVGDRSYIRLTSDNSTSTSRNFVLSQSTVEGQILILEWTHGTNEGELADDSSQTGGGTTRLNGLWPATTNQLNDTITLISNGIDWIERARSAN